MKRNFLLIPHLKIHNANAMSSPFTIGFPAMTAWLGAMHALERKLHSQKLDINLIKLAVSCHHFDLQTYKGRRDYLHSLVAKASPLNKNGGRTSLIEEARCHLEVSLLIELDGYSQKNYDSLIAVAHELVMSMKVASGDVQNVWPCEILSVNEMSDDGSVDLKRILHKLMLGNVLIERRDLVAQSMNDGKDAIDSLLEYLTVNHAATDEMTKEGKTIWQSTRKEDGWLVPIAVGYQGISPLSEEKVLNQRDDDTPHRFAESIVTLGEFIMPYRAKAIDEILWEYCTDLENDLYLCRNQI